MSTNYTAHVQRAQSQGMVPLTVSQFIRLVVQIYHMEQYETQAK